MYGELGKNASQEKINGSINNLLIFSFLFTMIAELATHGMNARNKFQFRKR